MKRPFVELLPSVRLIFERTSNKLPTPFEFVWVVMSTDGGMRLNNDEAAYVDENGVWHWAFSGTVSSENTILAWAYTPDLRTQDCKLLLH